MLPTFFFFFGVGEASHDLTVENGLSILSRDTYKGTLQSPLYQTPWMQ